MDDFFSILMSVCNHVVKFNQIKLVFFAALIIFFLNLVFLLVKTPFLLWFEVFHINPPAVQRLMKTRSQQWCKVSSISCLVDSTERLQSCDRKPKYGYLPAGFNNLMLTKGGNHRVKFWIHVNKYFHFLLMN